MPEDRLTYLGIRIHDARKACKLTQQELADETGVSIKMIQCIENGSVNPSYEILFPIVNRLGLTTSDLFSVEPDQHMEEINRFLGKFRACNRSNQLLLLKEALIKAGKGEVSSQKRRKCQGKERIEGRNPWNSYTSQLKGRKSPMRVGVNRPLWQAYTDLRWRRARVIG